MTYLELCKIRIALFSTFSAAVGFFLVSPVLDDRLLFLMPGVFLLACGAGALNQYQERDTDRRMERTRGRPLPSGRLRSAPALRFSLLLLGAGTAVLLWKGYWIVAAGGTGAVLWYNGLYTLLKRKSAFAAIPGAVIGTVPPAMGWVTGGGAVGDLRLWAVIFFFFMWQVPHFWLLLLERGNEYERAHLPCLSTIMTQKQLVRITSHWMYAAALSGPLIALYGLASSTVINFALSGAALWLGWQGLVLGKQRSFSAAFKKNNHYMIAVLILLTCEKLDLPAQIVKLIRVYLS